MNRARYMSVMKKTGILIFWLLVWEISALVVRNSLLVPSLGEIVKALAEILVLEDFCRILALSLGRILTGLFFAFVLGLLLAALSFGFSWVAAFLSPLFLSIKTIPIASYVILLLIWNGSETLSVGISFLVALPIIYTNVTEGLKGIDRRYLDLADVYGIMSWNKVWYIYRPQLSASILSCVKLACGMSIKAGVAAEIIGIPEHSFGEMLYMSKIYLSMDELFAWTIVIVLSALILEKLLLALTKVLFNIQIPAAENAAILTRTDCPDQEIGYMEFDNISKSFYDRIVIQNFSMKLNCGDVIGIMSPSGSGKSTLVRILLGLEQADNGFVKVNGRAAVVFQDDLLCESTDALTNMKLVSSGGKDVEKLAAALLDTADLHKKCRIFSGGMKRRTAILRALTSEYDILILDEPFAALDEDTKRKTAELIREEAAGKTILLFTHDEEDIKLLHGVCYTLGNYIFPNK